MFKFNNTMIGLALVMGLTGAANAQNADSMKNPLSVHVLNTQSGNSGSGIKVMLEKKKGNNWIALSQGTTDAGGRITALYPQGASQLEPGDYKVTFMTGDYFAAQNLETLFPEVPILIHVKVAEDHLHIPLLVSQYSYSTYKGAK